MATKNSANGDQLVPMAVDLMAPMVHPIAIGANDDRHWWLQLVTIGKIQMPTMAPQSWLPYGDNGNNGNIFAMNANDDSGDPLTIHWQPMVTMTPLATMVPVD